MDEIPEEFAEAKEARSPRRSIAAQLMTKAFYPTTLLWRIANQVRRLPEWSRDYWWMDSFRRRMGFGEPLPAYDAWEEGMAMLDGLLSLGHADRLELVRAESQAHFHTPDFLVVVLDHETEVRGSDLAKARELGELVAVCGSTASWRLMKKNPAAAQYLNDLAAVGEARMANVDRITGKGAAWTHARNARARISPRSDPWCRGEVESLCASLELEGGSYEEAGMSLTEAESAFRLADDEQKVLNVIIKRALLRDYQNNDPSEVYRSCLENIERSPAPERFEGQANIVRLNMTRAFLDFHESDVPSAVEAFNTVKPFSNQSVELHRRYVRGRLWLVQGFASRAIEELEAVQRGFGKQGEIFHQAYACVHLAQACLAGGQNDRCVAVAHAAAEVFMAPGLDSSLKQSAKELAQAATSRTLTLGGLREFANSIRSSRLDQRHRASQT